jgi:hypothetical protein
MFFLLEGFFYFKYFLYLSFVRYWRTTTDNLMTHDKTTFKELLTRIASLGQSNISLFSSKEQEQEQRALLLKGLCHYLNIFKGLYN